MTQQQANQLRRLIEKAEQDGALYGKDREEIDRLGEVWQESGGEDLACLCCWVA